MNPPDVSGGPAAPVFDPGDAATRADPFPLFRRLREEDPVHWCDALAGWVLTCYDDCRQALNDPRLSAERLRPFFEHLPPPRRAEVQGLEGTLGLWAVFVDPPDHTRLRRLLNRGFTSRAIDRLIPRIEDIVDGLLDTAAERGAMDFIADFAYPLPATVVMAMLGVPLDDLGRFKVWSDDLALFVGSAQMTPEKYQRAERAVREMGAYFRDLLAARRRRPCDDLISELLAETPDGQRLSEDELVASAILLLFAGHETTTNMLGTGLLQLLRHRDQMRRLVGEPALIGPAVEEILRYDGPIAAMTRVAAEPFVLRGRRIERGRRVYAMLNAANRDPRAFDDPERFDIAREPNRQIAFGYGIHFCLGAPLARLEGRIAFPRLLGRLQGIEFDEAALCWNDSLVLRGLKSLPIRFAPR
jgi:cytochrome P450